METSAEVHLNANFQRTPMIPWALILFDRGHPAARTKASHSSEKYPHRTIYLGSNHLFWYGIDINYSYSECVLSDLELWHHMRLLYKLHDIEFAMVDIYEKDISWLVKAFHMLGFPWFVNLVSEAS